MSTNQTTNTVHPIRLGIDFGGVIVPAANFGALEKSSILHPDPEVALKTGPLPGAIESVGQLVAALEGRVWIVSKAFPRTEARTLQWMSHWNFFGATGMCPDQVRFCRERGRKRDHCKELGITHFIDDRLDIMQILKGQVDHLFLFGPKRGDISVSGRFTPVAGWAEACHAILSY